MRLNDLIRTPIVNEDEARDSRARRETSHQALHVCSEVREPACRPTLPAIAVAWALVGIPLAVARHIAAGVAVAWCVTPCVTVGWRITPDVTITWRITAHGAVTWCVASCVGRRATVGVKFSPQLRDFPPQLQDHPIKGGFAVGSRLEFPERSHALPFSRTARSRVRLGRSARSGFGFRRPTLSRVGFR